MSQPSVHHTFDASIIDFAARSTNNTQSEDHYSETTTVMDSFSSRGSNDQQPAPEQLPSTSAATTDATPKPQRQTHYLPNTETYNLWAPTYDHDGNVLQSLDTYHLNNSYLSRFLTTLATCSPYIPPNPDGETAVSIPPPPLRITDLGTGTGRALLLLLTALRSTTNKTAMSILLGPKLDREIHITGIDASEGMLEVARTRLPSYSNDNGVRVRVDFAVWDLFSPVAPPTTNAHGLISTLVLEHVPLAKYFECVRRLLSDHGAALVTNMHPEMGLNPASTAPAWLASPGADEVGDMSAAEGKENERAVLTAVTGAGFVDTKTGAKVRAAEDYAHGVKETAEAASVFGGLYVVGEVGEGGVEEWMVQDGVVDEKRGRKWVGTTVRLWYGMVLTRER